MTPAAVSTHPNESSSTLLSTYGVTDFKQNLVWLDFYTVSMYQKPKLAFLHFGELGILRLYNMAFISSDDINGSHQRDSYAS